MQESFNPYAAFLGFPPGRPPRNYYELLGLPLLESDPEKISQAAERLRNQVRQIRPGSYLAQWQQILDELTAAKICLLDPVAKALYDESLQKGASPPVGGMATIPPAQAPSAAEMQGMVSGGLSPPEYPFSPAPPGPGPQYTQSEGMPTAQHGGIPIPNTPSPGIPWGTPVGTQWENYYASSGGWVPGQTASPSGWAPSIGQPAGVPSAGAPGVPSGWPTPAGGPSPSPSPGYPSGWPPLESQGYPPGQGVSGIPSVGSPLGFPGFPPAAPTPPPLPGETTQVAAKTALAQSRRSLAWWVAGCVGLLVLAGGLLYLLQRVRTEGPEVVLGKNSSEKTNSSSSAKQPGSGETPSFRPSGQTGSGTSPGAGQPPQKQPHETTPSHPGSLGNSPQPISPGRSPEPGVPSATPAPGSGGPSETTEHSLPGEEPTWPLSPSEKASPGMAEKPSPRPGEPSEKPPVPGSKPSVDSAKESAWQKAVEEVRTALAQHDLASAQEALQIAETHAQTAEQHEVVERLRMLRHYLEEFWNGIRQAVIRLEATQEFTVGSTRFAIVEGNSQYLIVRAEGRNIRWPIERIPGSVVELLAKRWFRTNNAATQLAFGAYYAVRGQKQDARQYWEQAAKSGSADAKALLEELRHWPLPEPKSPGGQSPLQ